MNNLETTWADSNGRTVLLATRCTGCGAVQFPASEMCPSCGPDQRVEPMQLSGNGRLYAFTELHQSKPAFPTPYYIGYVDLPEGVRVPGRLVNDTGRPLASGSAVQLGQGPIGVDRAGQPTQSYVFRAVSEGQGLSGERNE